MRIVILSAVALLALAITGASQPASTATKAVKITASAFTPASVTINTGDAVKWTNSDTKSHQVVANNGAFASPTIAAGKTYTHVFTGRFRAEDVVYVLPAAIVGEANAPLFGDHLVALGVAVAQFDCVRVDRDARGR